MRYKIVDATGKVGGETGNAQWAHELVAELNRTHPEEGWHVIDAKENQSGTLH